MVEVGLYSIAYVFTDLLKKMQMLYLALLNYLLVTNHYIN